MILSCVVPSLGRDNPQLHGVVFHSFVSFGVASVHCLWTETQSYDFRAPAMSFTKNGKLLKKTHKNITSTALPHVTGPRSTHCLGQHCSELIFADVRHISRPTRKADFLILTLIFGSLTRKCLNQYPWSSFACSCVTCLSFKRKHQ